MKIHIADPTDPEACRLARHCSLAPAWLPEPLPPRPRQQPRQSQLMLVSIALLCLAFISSCLILPGESTFAARELNTIATLCLLASGAGFATSIAVATIKGARHAIATARPKRPMTDPATKILELPGPTVSAFIDRATNVHKMDLRGHTQPPSWFLAGIPELDKPSDLSTPYLDMGYLDNGDFGGPGVSAATVQELLAGFWPELSAQADLILAFAQPHPGRSAEATDIMRQALVALGNWMADQLAGVSVALDEYWITRARQLLP